MTITKLNELLAAYALEHPKRPLSQVSAIEFAVWYAARSK